MYNEKAIIRFKSLKLIEQSYAYFATKAALSGRKIAPVLKSDAYGFGIKEVAKVLYKKGARIFFTADVYEACEIKNAVLANDIAIYTLHGYNHIDFSNCSNIYPVLNSYKELILYSTALNDARINKRAAALYLNTGMNYGGFCIRTAEEMTNARQQGYYNNVLLNIYMTHLCNVSLDINARQESSLQQCNMLSKFLKILPKSKISITATHGSLYIQHLNKMPIAQDIERIGVGLFGDIPGCEFAFSVYGRILSIHVISAGDTIGYECGYMAKKDIKVAIIDVGYGDGYPRSVSVQKNNDMLNQKRAYMSIGGYKAYIVGLVSMNLTCVDVTNIPEPILAKEQYAELIGRNVSIYHLADCVETTIEDVLIGLNRQNVRAQDNIIY